MIPTKTSNRQNDLFKSRLSTQLNPNNSIFILANQIDWSELENFFGDLHTFGTGQPPKPVRLMLGLMILQHTFGLSDENVVQQWVENPYWQYFCGYEFLQWEAPINPSSLTRWRKRLGKEGLEKVLSSTIQTAVTTKTVEAKDFTKVIVDTTVMEKNVSYPTDTKLLNKARENLVGMCHESGIKLRQTYARVGPQALFKASRYAHVKQFKRMRKQVKKTKTYLGRVVRDIECQLANHPEQIVKAFKNPLVLSKRLLLETKTSKNKVYSIHEPEVYCISKGKARRPYEFGCKVSLVVTHKQGLALSSQALWENQYDGHTLKAALANAHEVTETITKRKIKSVFVDKGYRGHEVEDQQVFISGRRSGMTPRLLKQLKRRSSIEPHIGHMKHTGKLDRNYLKGQVGDTFNAILCAIGHNIRLILRHITFIFVLFIINIQSNIINS